MVKADAEVAAVVETVVAAVDVVAVDAAVPAAVEAVAVTKRRAGNR